MLGDLPYTAPNSPDLALIRPHGSAAYQTLPVALSTRARAMNTAVLVTICSLHPGPKYHEGRGQAACFLVFPKDTPPPFHLCAE